MRLLSTLPAVFLLFCLNAQAAHSSSTEMTVSATVVVSCIDPDADLSDELRQEVSRGLCGRHVSIGSPVRISMTPQGISIVPSTTPNARIRTGEAPGEVEYVVYNPKIQAFEY